MRRKVLVTGGTGKVGRRTASALLEASANVAIATRTPRAEFKVAFDWSRNSSFKSFEGTQAMLVVAPPGVASPLTTMLPGLKRALDYGVHRFVLIGASSIEMDGPLTGEVYRWIADHAPSWAILRPTWFMQNLSEGQHLPTIRDQGRIYSATRNGRIPFIDADDIGRVAARLLLSNDGGNSEYLLTGPARLTYDDVALILSQVIGKEVRHEHLDPIDMTARFEGFGIPAEFARALAAMDAEIAKGAEDRVTTIVEQVTGRTPGTLRSFAEKVRPVWL